MHDANAVAIGPQVFLASVGAATTKDNFATNASYLGVNVVSGFAHSKPIVYISAKVYEAPGDVLAKTQSKFELSPAQPVAS